MDEITHTWIRIHRSRVVHPSIIIDFLSRYHSFPEPLRIYSALESRGCFVPRAYKNGEITAVQVQNPKPNFIETVDEYLCEDIGKEYDGSWADFLDKLIT